MKIKILLIIAFVSINAFCQVPKGALSIEDESFNSYFLNKKNIPTVKGKILNVSKKAIEKAKIRYSIVTPFEKGHVAKFCKLKEDGSFELELDHAFPNQQIWLSVGRLFYTSIYANKDLYLELDAAILKVNKGTKYFGSGVKYLGTDGKLNTFLNKNLLYKIKIKRELQKRQSLLRRNRKISYDVFLSKYDSIYNEFKKIDNEFIQNNPSKFSWLISNERKSDYYSNLCVKHWNKEMDNDLFEKIKNHKSYLTSNKGNSFYRCLFIYLKIIANKKFKQDFEAYKTSARLTTEEVAVLDSIKTIEKHKEKSQPYDELKYKALIEKSNTIALAQNKYYRTTNTLSFLDSLFKQPKADMLKLRISSKNPDDKKIMMEAVLENIKTEWCKKEIKKQYDESVKKLKSINNTLKETKSFSTNLSLGKPMLEMPFGAKLYTVNNVKAKELLANIKESFKGKALVLDFWGTWCAPCLQDMPYSTKLHDQLENEPIEFVYLCTSRGSSLNKWKSKIADLKVSGTHLFVDASIEAELMELFSFSGFPSYAFINKKGEYKPGKIKRMQYLNEKQLKAMINE
jgi:thiol-disulfide isomerase/thioredoxin